MQFLRRRFPLPFNAEAAFGWAGGLIGFGLAGLFDGILLQQVLQWHHLLGGVSRGALAELPVQVLADGLFQGVMLLMLFGGLVLLVLRGREPLARPGGDMRLLGHALIGFGTWPFLDKLLLNALLGLHRVRAPTWWCRWCGTRSGCCCSAWRLSLSAGIWCAAESGRPGVCCPGWKAAAAVTRRRLPCAFASFPSCWWCC